MARTLTEKIMEIVNMCADIYAHDELDFEITLGNGNGTNSNEARNVADEIMKILGVEKNDLKFTIESKIEKLLNVN